MTIEMDGISYMVKKTYFFFLNKIQKRQLEILGGDNKNYIFKWFMI